MRNPFSLLTKGIILAICWWVALSLVWMHSDGVLAQVWPRLLFWLAGIGIAGLAASLILLNQRESLRLILEPSHYWGVNVTLGRFPVVDERPPRRDGPRDGRWPRIRARPAPARGGAVRRGGRGARP